MDERQENSGLIFGRNAVMEAIKADAGVERIVIQRNIEGNGKKIFSLAKRHGIPVQGVDRQALDRMAGTKEHQGVAAMVADYEYSDIDAMLADAAQRGEAPFLVALDGIEDPHNLGAILRTAEGAGVHGIVIPKNRAASVNGTVMKVSAGAAAHMKVARVSGMTAALTRLKEKGLWTYGLDMAGGPYRDADYQGGVVLVIGNEGAGLSRLVRETCDFLISIPMRGKMASLNASNAAAIVMYEVTARGRDVL
jgi:23S rRNA (guanosine2251-2'-O)-methyltransferase